MSGPRPTIDGYAAALERLAPDRIGDLMAMCREDVRFKDPFNDVRGRSAFAHVLEDMFRKVHDLRFDVGHRVAGDDVWVLCWQFAGRARWVGSIRFDGVSVVTLDGDGRVAGHVDLWDGAVLYDRLPLVGALTRRLRRAFRG